MPQQPQSSPAQDKDFLAAAPEDQLKYLSAQDPEFASASREDQMGYISHLTGKPLKDYANTTPAPKQPSTWDVLTQPTEKTDKEYLGYTGPAGVAGATIHGMSNVARGVQDFGKGMVNTVRHPIETAKSVAQLPKMAMQVPSAMRDVNSAPGATDRYLQVAEDTASQGAGQALGTLATMGVPRMVPPAIRLAARSGEAALNQKLVPVRPIFNLGTMADDAGAVKVKVPGRDFGLTKPIYPGAPEPMAPPKDFLSRNAQMADPHYRNPGAMFPERPAVYPGAPFPEKPPLQVMQARGLMTGAKPPVDEAAALGRIPTPAAEPEPIPFKPKGKMGGRYVLTPEEARQAEQIQRIALQRAKERGMQYAGGMKPSGAKVQTP